jgi:hypothetical protein
VFLQCFTCPLLLLSYYRLLQSPCGCLLVNCELTATHRDRQGLCTDSSVTSPRHPYLVHISSATGSARLILMGFNMLCLPQVDLSASLHKGGRIEITDQELRDLLHNSMM